jgi:hypothetical protein
MPDQVVILNLRSENRLKLLRVANEHLCNENEFGYDANTCAMDARVRCRVRRHLCTAGVFEDRHTIVGIRGRAVRKAVNLFHLFRERTAHDQPHDGFDAF